MFMPRKVCVLMLLDNTLISGWSNVLESTDQWDWVINRMERHDRAIQICRAAAVDAVVIASGDCSMGIRTTRTVRSAGLGLPLLGVLSDGTEKDRLSLFDAGADYSAVLSPHSLELLKECIRSLIRSGSVTSRSWKRELCIGDLRLRELGQAAYLNGEHVELSPQQWRLLFCLVLHLGQTVGNDRLCTFAGVTRSHDGGSHKNLRNQIARLRSRLGNRVGFQIRSIRGTGYAVLSDQPEPYPK